MSKSETVNISRGYHVTARSIVHGGVYHGRAFDCPEFAARCAINQVMPVDSVDVELIVEQLLELDQTGAAFPSVKRGDCIITLMQTPESCAARVHA